MTTDPDLPEPTRTDRWQPIRCGLLDLYRFEDEVFVFEGGRLLLRGNNGTGKSRVLALTLPFLLEGEIASHRVEPDGDPAKKMEWNLLMGSRPARLGYTWIEFGRRLVDGTAEYTTLGCGLKAAEGRGLTGHWFFVTSQRIGRDLFLAENRVAHTQAKLTQALGTAGKVFTKAAEYRQAVDAKLFGLGAQYGALLNLLVQLRQPQLSRKFDEELVSRALSDALPPLSDAILGEVAEAFRNLQTEADELTNVQAAHTGTETFLREYRRYTQIVARRRARRVLTAEKDHQSALTRQRQYQSAKENAKRALADIAESIAKFASDETKIAARQQALRDSPEQRSANQITAARLEADAAEDALQKADALRKTGDVRLASAEKDSGTQQASTDRALAAAEQKNVGALTLARAAALEHEHRDVLGSLQFAASSDSASLQRAEQQLSEKTTRRLSNVKHLEKQEAAVRDQEAEWRQAQRTQTEREGQRDAAIEEQARRVRELERATEATVTAYGEWTRQVVELTPMGADHFEEWFTDWVETGAGTTTLAGIVQAARGQAGAAVAEKRADADYRKAAIENELIRLDAAYAALEKGRHQPPLPPPTRNPESRVGRAGAPFYTLFDFREELEPSARAGLEAALEGAGLLDAWITPEGRALYWDDLDAAIIPSNEPLPGQTLRDVLRPEEDSPIRAEVAQVVLRSIGLGEGTGSAWVGTDGSWQLGPLRGTWRKPAAQHLGASAREQERQRQMAELERQRASCRTDKIAVEAELTALDVRRRNIDREAAAAPSDSTVRQAISDRDSATAQVNRWHQQVEAAEKTVRERRTAWNAAVQTRDRDADELSLTAWLGKLSALKEDVHAYRDGLGGLWRALDTLVSARAQAAKAEAHVAGVRSDAEEKTRQADEARKKHEVLKTRYETLEESAGATVRQLHEKQEKYATELVRVRADKSDQEKANLAESNKLAVAENNLGQIVQELKRAEDENKAATAALHSLGKVRLLGVAHDDFREADTLDWTPKGAADTARRIETLLQQTASGDDAWKRNQDAILEHIEVLKRSLAQSDFMVEPAPTEDGIFVVNVPFQGRTCTMAELREALASDITTRHTLLAAREREAIERYLLEEVASELHHHLREGEAWVRRANDELAARPMQTGMALHFKWEPHEDGAPGLLAARKQLLQLGSAWSPADRQALGGFLHEQITRARRHNFAGGWKQHLEEALDYRRWHRFRIEQRRERDGEWKRLTKRTHGTGSGGEKAVALTLPQFAAAAAHYQSVPHAPRLILLDEAFVGVDSEMRRKCMDLLTIFDLDLVMTSEREWGCYPTVPALAIYQLARRDGIDAVGITRWVWNGQGPFTVDRPVAGASAPDAPPLPPSELSFDAD